MPLAQPCGVWFPGWEGALARVPVVQTLRARKYQWRTEQSYRGWATRFTAWLERRGGRIEEVTAPQVRDFLTELATQRRVAASTQRQAVNALVFLVREALGRDPGQFGDFVRARHRVRMPVVLSRAECQRLFAALQGTPRLMAELMYGSGLRLTENE